MLIPFDECDMTEEIRPSVLSPAFLFPVAEFLHFTNAEKKIEKKNPTKD